MYIRNIIAICIGVFMSLTATAWSATVTKLPNGLTVLTQKDERFPLVSLRLYVHAGSAFETAQQAGISHLLEHMVFKGTAKRPKGGVAGDVEKAGGYINAATSFDYTVYMADMPSKDWKLGMDVLNDMTFGATIDAEELESEKKVVIAELERGEDSPGSLMFKRLQALALPGTTYARPIIGYRETINNFTRDDIKNYISTFYQPQSMLLAVVGNIDEAAVLSEAERLFGQLTNNTRITPPAPMPPAPPHDGPRVTVEHGKWNKVYLGIALPLPGFNDADSTGLETLAHLLGGDRTSRLYRTFKYQRQLVDDISLSAYQFERTGFFYLTAVLDSEKLEAFWPELMRELKAVTAADFTDEEIARAKLNLEDSLFRSKETLSGLTSKLGMFQFFSNGEEGENRYLKELQGVSRAHMQSLLDTYMQPERLNAHILLPEGTPATSDSLADAVRTVWPVQNTQQAVAEVQQAKQQQEVIDLGKGRKVILLPDTTLPYVSVDIAYQGGDSLLAQLPGAPQQGLPTLTARTLTKGTAARTATELEEFQADRAASIGAGAGRYTFNLRARFPKRFGDDITGVLTELITSPAFAEKEIAREKRGQIAGIKAREDQPLGLAFRNLFPFLFDHHVYGYFHEGTPESIAAMQQQDVTAFWQLQSAQPWVMAVCGNYDREAIIALAESLPVPAGKRDTPLSPAWGGTQEKTLHLAERNQSHLLMVFKTAPLNHANTPGLELMQSILAGQSGLLFSDLRDKHGLGYTVTAIPWQSELAGFLAFYIGTEPGREQEALDGFRRIITQLHTEELSETELLRGKNQLRGDYYRDHQTIGSRSSEAASLASSNFPLTLHRDIIDAAEKVTAKELKALARKYLDADTAYLMQVTP